MNAQQSTARKVATTQIHPQAPTDGIEDLDIGVLLNFSPGQPTVFKDDYWNLNTHPTLIGKNTAKSINFAGLDPWLKNWTKVYLAAQIDPLQLQAELEKHDHKVDVSTAVGAAYLKTHGQASPASTAMQRTSAVIRLLRRMQDGGLLANQTKDWEKVTALITTTVGDDKRGIQPGEPVSGEHARLSISVLRAFDRFVRQMTTSTTNVFQTAPWGSAPPHQIVPRTADDTRKNRTPPDPNAVRIFGFAHTLINEFGDDIIRVVAHWNDPTWKHYEPGNRDRISKDGKKRLEELYSKEVTRALPIRKPSGRGTNEIEFWGRALFDACRYVTQFCLAQRNRDVNLLTVDAIVRRDHTGEGPPMLKGFRTKNVPKAQSVEFPATTIVTQAIDMANRLREAWRYDADTIMDHKIATKNLERLFTPPPTRNSRNRNVGDRVRDETEMIRSLKNAAQRLKEREAIESDLSEVETFNTMSIRITSLISMADHPLGLALAASYGMWSRHQVMDGYMSYSSARQTPLDLLGRPLPVTPAGIDEDFDSDADEIRQVVKAARAQMLIDNQHELSGRGKDRLIEKLEAVPVELGRKSVLTSKEARKVANANKNFEVGLFTGCDFREAGAMCGGSGAANWLLCVPGACSNSVETKANRAVIELQRRQTEASDFEFVKLRNKQVLDAHPGLVEEFKDFTIADLINLVREEGHKLLRLVLAQPTAAGDE